MHVVYWILIVHVLHGESKLKGNFKGKNVEVTNVEVTNLKVTNLEVTNLVEEESKSGMYSQQNWSTHLCNILLCCCKRATSHWAKNRHLVNILKSCDLYTNSRKHYFSSSSPGFVWCVFLMLRRTVWGCIYIYPYVYIDRVVIFTCVKWEWECNLYMCKDIKNMSLDVASYSHSKK